jgi:branched-subunit amino acid aminotransferase/4-amino-4-deoxychorismate lyase
VIEWRRTPTTSQSLSDIQVHPVIYLNKTMVEATKARVAPVSSAMLYGRGVFTSLAVHNGKPLQWSNHWNRLSAHGKKLDIELGSCTLKSVGDALQKLIKFNQVSTGRAHVILLARGGRDLVRIPSDRKVDLLILTSEPRPVPENGLSLAVSPYRVNTFSPLTGVKSLNYLDRILSSEEAQQRDFDEAVMLNERGEIVSATLANIFWTRNGTVHTPALSTGAIAGITRESVIQIAAKSFIPLVEGVYEMSDLVEADEIFLTSSALGVAPVTTFDFRRYSISSESIVTMLRNGLDRLVAESS